MSKREYKIVLKKEIDQLNRKIDEKILWGLSYKQEARRHKELISKMRNLGKQSVWGRAFSLMSLF